MEKVKKKILFITPYFYPENIPANKLFQLINKDKFELIILTALPNYKIFKFFKNYSILGPYSENFYDHKILRMPIIPRFSNSFFSIFLFYSTFFLSSFFFIFFWGLLNRNKFYHVTSYCGSPVFVGYLGKLFSILTKCKNSIWIQDIWPEAIITSFSYNKDKKIFKIINFLQKKMWLFSDVIFSESPMLTRYLKKEMNNKKIITLYNPIKENIKYQSRSNSTNNKKQIIISYFGNVGKTQNIERVFYNIGNEITFNICGDGNDFERLKNKYKNKKNINFYKWMNEKELEEIAKTSSFFYLSINQHNRQKYIIPSKFQTYIHYEKPIIFFGDKLLCDFINDNNIGIGIETKINESINISSIMNNFKKNQYSIYIKRIKELKKSFLPESIVKIYTDTIL